MTFDPTPPLLADAPALDAVALHLLRALVQAGAEGHATHLEELAETIGVRKVDCRRALSTLHRQGYVDVLRMRPTLAGMAIGSALREAPLRELRAERAPARRVPAAPASGTGRSTPPPASHRAA
jgi:hypothetical protein